MDWHTIAIEMAKSGKNSGEITRALQAVGFFEGEDFAPCYERVRKYVRKHYGNRDGVKQNFIPSKTKENWTGDSVIKFAIVSDTHIGSKWVQLTHLHNFYKECAKRNVETVYHCGDITDGYQMRVGQENEIYCHGATEFIDEVVRNYPMVGGIKTKFILGNHDGSFFKQCGLDIGREIEKHRPDMEYLGRDCAVVDITDSISIELRHPWDGSGYAVSQKAQKLVDNMYKNKPTILAIGHYHKMEYLQYKDVHCFQTGCFQGRTPFEVGKNIIPYVGGWIVTLNVDKNGNIKSIIPECIYYSDEIDNDYINFD